MQQTIEYCRILDVPFEYISNGDAFPSILLGCTGAEAGCAYVLVPRMRNWLRGSQRASWTPVYAM